MKTRIRTLIVILVTLHAGAAAAETSTASLEKQVAELGDMVKSLQSELASTRDALEKLRNNSVLALDGMLVLQRDYDGVETAMFRGVNVQIVNGSGETGGFNGSGNLILGYNRNSGSYVDRMGSHNLVLGDDQSYPGTTSIVAGDISSKDLSLTVSGNLVTAVGKNVQTSIGGNQLVSVGSSRTLSVQKDFNQAVGQDYSESVGGSLLLDAGDEVALTTGSASQTMKKDGSISLQGKDILLKGSGSVIIKGSKILQN